MIADRLGWVNRKLTNQQIESTYQALSSTGEAVSGRALRAALKARYGAAGKTARVFAICRSLGAGRGDESATLAALRRRLADAEQAAAAAEAARVAALERAERSESREIAHQDRWANEIHELRQTAQQLQAEHRRRVALEDQVLRLQRELQILRLRREPGANPGQD
jgi:hypothetical protein